MKHEATEDRHKLTAQRISTVHFPAIRAAMKIKGAKSGSQELEAAIYDALNGGINFALDAEARAWTRVNELEDMVISLVKHAPGSDLMRARELAKDIEGERMPLARAAQ
jgi:hypothetical protein